MHGPHGSSAQLRTSSGRLLLLVRNFHPIVGGLLGVRSRRLQGLAQIFMNYKPHLVLLVARPSLMANLDRRNQSGNPLQRVTLTTLLFVVTCTSPRCLRDATRKE